MSRNYDEASVIRSLSKKRSIKIDSVNSTIKVDIDATDIGNGSWGKIDYLCHYKGYCVVRVKNIINRKGIIPANEDENFKIKHREKINMATMAKSAMKRVKDKE